MKTYKGVRLRNNQAVVAVKADGARWRRLSLRLDLRRHSPTGLEWGYGGSGPAQLALALLADVLGDDDAVALRYYQDFKRRVVQALEHDGWQMTDYQIRARLAELAKERDAANG